MHYSDFRRISHWRKSLKRSKPVPRSGSRRKARALADFHWQSGYGGFSVSAGDVEEVVEYIAQQESHHRVASYQDEFRKLLDAHGIAYDERYVWD